MKEEERTSDGTEGRAACVSLRMIIDNELRNYLIEHEGIDWPDVLASWSWLLPRGFTLWLVNLIGDLFIVTADSAVHMLDCGAGTLTKVAESRDDFARRIDEDDNANDWLAIPLVDKLVASGKQLQLGECYAFKVLPILGGDYVVENFGIVFVADWLGACGSMHEQMRDVPDGANIVIRVERSGEQ